MLAFLSAEADWTVATISGCGKLAHQATVHTLY